MCFFQYIHIFRVCFCFIFSSRLLQFLCFLLQLSQALKRDVVNTVFSRIEMLLEDLLMNEGGKK